MSNYRLTIRAALSAALRHGLITTNPAEGHIDSMPRVGGDDDEPTMREPEETARFLGHVAGDRLAALYELAAHAGVRRAELCGLRWSDLDTDGAGLRVRQSIVEVTRSQVTVDQIACPVCHQEHVGRLFKRPKSRAGRRWVPLAKPAQEAPARIVPRNRTSASTLGPDYQDHDLVFCEYDGRPLRPGTVTDAFETHVKACGLPVIRLHDTRHGACSLLLSGGVPIEVVQMILGHSSPEITRRVYAHLLRKATAAQVESATELLTRHRRPPESPEDDDDEAPA